MDDVNEAILLRKNEHGIEQALHRVLGLDQRRKLDQRRQQLVQTNYRRRLTLCASSMKNTGILRVHASATESYEPYLRVRADRFGGGTGSCSSFSSCASSDT